MRFNKPSRKIRIKKKKNNKSDPKQSVSFVIYLSIGIVLLAIFYFIIYQRHGEQLILTRKEKIQDDMDKICSAAILYFQDHGKYPLRSQGIDILTKTSISSQDTDMDVPGTKYLARIPLDPWKTRYDYQYNEKIDSIILTCWGSDRKPGGIKEAADIIRQGCPPSSFPPQ